MLIGLVQLGQASPARAQGPLRAIEEAAAELGEVLEAHAQRFQDPAVKLPTEQLQQAREKLERLAGKASHAELLATMVRFLCVEDADPGSRSPWPSSRP